MKQSLAHYFSQDTVNEIECNICNSLQSSFLNEISPSIQPKVAEQAMYIAFARKENSTRLLTQYNLGFDIKVGSLGVNVKTIKSSSSFKLYEMSSMQKELKFFCLNKERHRMKVLKKIINRFNERIREEKDFHELNDIYDLVLCCDNDNCFVYEKRVKEIDFDRIRNIQETKSSYSFEFEGETYRFQKSNNTLSMTFNDSKYLFKMRLIAA